MKPAAADEVLVAGTSLATRVASLIGNLGALADELALAIDELDEEGRTADVEREIQRQRVQCLRFRSKRDQTVVIQKSIHAAFLPTSLVTEPDPATPEPREESAKPEPAEATFMPAEADSASASVDAEHADEHGEVPGPSPDAVVVPVTEEGPTEPADPLLPRVEAALGLLDGTDAPLGSSPESSERSEDDHRPGTLADADPAPANPGYDPQEVRRAFDELSHTILPRVVRQVIQPESTQLWEHQQDLAGMDIPPTWKSLATRREELWQRWRTVVDQAGFQITIPEEGEPANFETMEAVDTQATQDRSRDGTVAACRAPGLDGSVLVAARVSVYQYVATSPAALPVDEPGLAEDDADPETDEPAGAAPGLVAEDGAEMNPAEAITATQPLTESAPAPTPALTEEAKAETTDAPAERGVRDDPAPTVGPPEDSGVPGGDALNPLPAGVPPDPAPSPRGYSADIGGSSAESTPPAAPTPGATPHMDSPYGRPEDAPQPPEPLHSAARESVLYSQDMGLAANDEGAPYPMPSEAPSFRSVEAASRDVLSGHDLGDALPPAGHGFPEAGAAVRQAPVSPKPMSPKRSQWPPASAPERATALEAATPDVLRQSRLNPVKAVASGAGLAAALGLIVAGFAKFFAGVEGVAWSAVGVAFVAGAGGTTIGFMWFAHSWAAGAREAQ